MKLDWMYALKVLLVVLLIGCVLRWVLGLVFASVAIVLSIIRYFLPLLCVLVAAYCIYQHEENQ